MEPPPGNPAEAIELIREIVMDAREYFGIPGEGVDPVHAQMKQQNMVDQFLLTWMEVFGQVLALNQQFLSDGEWQEITGEQAPDRNFERIQRGAGWHLKFDVRDLNTDWMLAKLKAFAEFVLPADAAGTIDRAKFVQVCAAWVDPSIARAVISDATTASQQLFSRVQQDFALMALGNDVVPEDSSDPTAPRQLEYGRQIMQANPKYQQQMRQDPRFAELVQKWSKNKEFALQQQQNKVIGRIGVQPAEAMMMGGQT
jgi:hypothetical protein